MKTYQIALLICLLCPGMTWSADSDIRLNSLGFLPQAQKLATIVSECSRFTIKRSTDDTVIFSGELTGPISQQDVNQKAWTADFSRFSESGRYYLDVQGVGRSYDFEIGEKVYRFAFYTSMRAFYLWRCGTAVQGEYGGRTYSHGPCHLEDGRLDYIGAKDTRKDGRGGWHDAGDYGKYTVNAGVTVGVLFLAWDHFRDRIESISLDIPAAPAEYPDFLKEIKWEIDWLLKMQYPDGSGKVSHKLTRLNFSGFIMPEKDSAKRYFTEWSSAATADSVAMLAMAARHFKPYDPQYAETCLEAAQKSYAFLKDNPDNKRFNQGPFKTGGYQTGDGDDRLWAAAEMWETTGEAEYLKDFEAKAVASNSSRRRGRTSSRSKIDENWDWGNVRNLGMFTYLLSKRQGKNPELVQALGTDLLSTADAIVAKVKQDIYGRSLGGRYYWGCNGTIARQTVILQVANKLLPKPEYVNAALESVGHLFGRNYYGRSYVTGLGHQSPMNPHDRRSGADGIKEPWPGYVVGGGHSATGWKDEQSDYRTNEIAANWQGALVYALAGFVQ
jgi:endoglucanase